ncbi:ATP-binding protein [soil metagenome]
MQLHRLELDILIKWLNKSNRKPLIIRGARQVGKSTLVRQLANSSQRLCLELNFERTPELSDFFVDKDPKQIIQKLSIYAKRPLNPDTTLLFLDEVQAAPQVLATLRYFYEEYPEFPVIVAGSLLDFALEAPEFSMPVGRIEYFHLGPLSFEDFLLALGETALVEWIRSLSIHDTIPLPLHQQCLNLVKQFWLIGGMPEVVAHFSEYADFQEIDNLKQNILQTYQDDFHKYGRAKQIPLLRRVFQTLPGLIGQTLKYSHIDRDSKSTQVREAIEDLQLARIIRLVYHSHASGLPLRAQIDPKIFKVIFLDIGLQCTALGLNQLDIIKGPDWAWINRGSLAEQFIGQALLKLNPSYHAPELFYWVREKSQSAAELDYLWQHKNHIIPIEVKAGKTGTLKSLHYFIREKSWSYAVRFNADVPSLLQETARLPNQDPIEYRLLSLPFYLAEQLERLLASEWV